MAEELTLAGGSTEGETSDAPSGTGESKAVRQLSSQEFPVLLLLLFRELEQRVVVLLELLVVLIERSVVAPATVRRRRVSATTAAATTSTLALQIDEQDLASPKDDGRHWQ